MGASIVAQSPFRVHVALDIIARRQGIDNCVRGVRRACTGKMKRRRGYVLACGVLYVGGDVK